MEMPGWGYGPDKAVDPNYYFGAGRPTNMMRNTVSKFNCQNCLDCENGDEESPQRCCGCASMDYIYGYSDIPNCLSCSDEDGKWPGGTLFSKRDNVSTFDEDEEDEVHSLHRRAAGKATKSVKEVSVCGDRYWNAGKYRYPAFPRDASFPWDGIENGKWDSISKYWGNASDSCSNWAVTDKKPADRGLAEHRLAQTTKVRKSNHDERRMSPLTNIYS